MSKVPETIAKSCPISENIATIGTKKTNKCFALRFYYPIPPTKWKDMRIAKDHQAENIKTN